MTQLSVREAAYRVGVTRQTLFKYIRLGKVSATTRRDGQKQVDISELIRVFGELQVNTVATDDRNDKRTLSSTTSATPAVTILQLDLERMKSQLQFKDAELALARERIDELKARETEAKHRERESTEERLRMLGVIEQQNRLLAAPVPTPRVRTVSTSVPKASPAPAKKTPSESITKKQTTTKKASEKTPNQTKTKKAKK